MEISKDIFNYIINSKKPFSPHQLSWIIYYNHKIPVDENGELFVIHHKDGNHYNNDPLNLLAISRSNHHPMKHPKLFKDGLKKSREAAWKKPRTKNQIESAKKLNSTRKHPPKDVNFKQRVALIYLENNYNQREVGKMFGITHKSVGNYAKDFPLDFFERIE